MIDLEDLNSDWIKLVPGAKDADLAAHAALRRRYGRASDLFYSEDQARDESGKWTDGGGGRKDPGTADKLPKAQDKRTGGPDPTPPLPQRKDQTPNPGKVPRSRAVTTDDKNKDKKRGGGGRP